MATIEETLLIKVLIDVKQTTAAVEQLEKQFSGLSNSIKSAFNIAQNKEPLDKLNQNQKQAADSAEKLTDAINKQKRAFDATKFPEGSYRQLNAQLKDLNNRFKELSATERQGAIGQALAKDIVKLKNQLKGIDASIGDFQRNVGNYAGSLRGFFKNLGSQLSSTALVGRIPTLPALLGAVQNALQFVQRAATAVTEAFSANARSTRILQEAQDEIVNSYIKERAQLDSLFAAAVDENATKEEKADAITKINALYGQYLPNQLTEKSTEEEIAAAYRATNAAIIENIVQKQRAQIIEKALKEAIDANIEARKAEAVATVSSFTDAFGVVNKLNSTLQSQNAETAKRAAANTSFIEEAIRQTLQDINNLGLDFTKALSEGDNEQAGAFEVLSKRRGELEKEIRDLIASGQDYSSQQRELASVTRQLSAAENEFAAATRFSENELQRLQRRKGELEEQIKLLILANKDYSKQQLELQKITEKLTNVEEAFAQVNKKAETQLEALSRRQKELNDEIQNAIANNQPYGDQLNELINVTRSLNGVNKEFQDVQNRINKELREFADGSLADYDQQIKELQESQKNLNITSIEYADITKQIESLETQRSVILKALSADVQNLNAEQKALTSELTDEQAQNEALQRAKDRISQVTDATGEGAAQILQIQKDLDNELKAIEKASLQRKIADIDAEIIALEAQRDKDLSLVGGNEQAQLAIKAQFEKDKTALQLEQAAARGQILKTEVDEATAAQDQITANAQENAEKRKQIEQQVLEAVSQGISLVFQAISEAQQKAAEKELEQLDAEKKAAIDRANSFGASQEKIAEIEAEFDKKRADAEKEAANRSKEIALAQAAIEIALSVLKASASAPPPANIPAIIAASALGAIQLAIIAAQQFAAGAIFDMDVRNGGGNLYAKGGYLQNGAYHSGGGMPILNPFTGRKVAEIEKGEAIINRKSTRLFYDELSFINSFNGHGVSFPNAASGIGDVGDLRDRMKQKGLAYAVGGLFASLSPNVLKLQNGAVVAAEIAREQNARFANTNSQAAFLNTLISKLDQLIKVNKDGFASIPSTDEEIRRAAQLLRDERNAS